MACDPPRQHATLFTGKVEQGNGSPNALAQIAAEELDFPFDRLFVVMGTTTNTVDQGPTYGSMAVRYAGPQIRYAAAADARFCCRWPANACVCRWSNWSRDGGVVSVVGAPDRSLTLWRTGGRQAPRRDDRCDRQEFDMKVAPDAPLKDSSKYTIVGPSVPRKDIPGKVTGEFTYVHDVKVPNMLHGRVVRPSSASSPGC